MMSVGGAQEEFNLGQPGANYGWPWFEGTEEYGITPDDYVPPIYTYSIDDNPACAITGGAFYNPPINQFPEDYIGDYFFADFCAGMIWVYDIEPDVVEEFATDAPVGIVDVEVGPEGSLYYVVYNTTSLIRVGYILD